MEFFKKINPTKSKNKETSKTKILSLDEESKKDLRNLKLTQEKYIENACFFMVQERALDKSITIFQQIMFLKGEKNPDTDILCPLEREAIRMTTLLQKKIEKFLLTEKRGEQGPLIRHFLLAIKDIEKEDPSYQELSSIKKSLQLFIKTKEDFTQERIKNISLANQLEAKEKRIPTTERYQDISVEDSFLTEDSSKSLDSQIFSNRKSIERLLS
jgi:hypothetical protein